MELILSSCIQVSLLHLLSCVYSMLTSKLIRIISVRSYLLELLVLNFALKIFQAFKSASCLFLKKEVILKASYFKHDHQHTQPQPPGAP